MYKKRKTHEMAHDAEDTFAQQFFNFMRKNPQYVVQMPILEINLDLSATVQQEECPGAKKNVREALSNLYEPTFLFWGPTGHVNQPWL
jgi:hypothetical protein